MKKKQEVKESFIDFLRSSHAGLIIFIEVIIGLFLSLGSFLLFVEIAENVLKKGGIYLDTTISQSIYALRTPFLNTFMRTVSYIGGEGLIVLSVIIFLILLIKQLHRETIFFTIIVAGGYILNMAIKELLRVPRPSMDPMYIEKFYSFPSGHSMNSCIFFAMVTYGTYYFTKNKKITAFVGFFAAFATLLVGFSRIYLGVHYPSDVIAGFITGLWWFTSAIVIEQTMKFYHLFRSRATRTA